MDYSGKTLSKKFVSYCCSRSVKSLVQMSLHLASCVLCQCACAENWPRLASWLCLLLLLLYNLHSRRVALSGVAREESRWWINSMDACWTAVSSSVAHLWKVKNFQIEWMLLFVIIYYCIVVKNEFISSPMLIIKRNKIFGRLSLSTTVLSI